MSGHSKWSQIKRQKGSQDAKRGQLFTKIANAISIAVRESGGISDPGENFKLRLAIEKARAVNMPKENIKRAIERGKGLPAGGTSNLPGARERGEGLEEITYEGFGPGGIGVIVECVTDNRQRTLAEVKNIFERYGGKLLKPGSLSYQFTKTGLLVVKKTLPADTVVTKAIDAGANDLEETDDAFEIYTEPSSLKSIKETLEREGLIILEAELSRKPVTTMPIKDRDTGGKVLSFMEELETLNSVQKVYSNFDIPDNLLNSNI